jgi:hypothetical protein
MTGVPELQRGTHRPAFVFVVASASVIPWRCPSVADDFLPGPAALQMNPWQRFLDIV